MDCIEQEKVDFLLDKRLFHFVNVLKDHVSPSLILIVMFLPCTM